MRSHGFERAAYRASPLCARSRYSLSLSRERVSFLSLLGALARTALDGSHNVMHISLHAEIATLRACINVCVYIKKKKHIYICIYFPARSSPPPPPPRRPSSSLALAARRPLTSHYRLDRPATRLPRACRLAYRYLSIDVDVYGTGLPPSPLPSLARSNMIQGLSAADC